MKTISIWMFILVAVVFFVFPKTLAAVEETINCSNRYVTLVNPVRARNLWIDKSLNPLKDQYDAVKGYNFSATWLLQYDVLQDKELLGEIDKFDKNQEKGVFLEVSPDFAEHARILYPHAVPWFSPGAVFLSGYSQSDRRKLIDKLFTEFKSKFGSYPKSVGAWWVDSYSLAYMKEKYDIKSVMIVADQRTTDNYGVWGQWWGVPYYPARANILTPAGSLDNKLDVVITQWAQRHPVLAFGGGFRSSYSLQANDYTLLGQDIIFFKTLTDIYLDCINPLGQITIGIETGMEGEKFKKQYQEQLEYLSKRVNLKAVTLSEFASSFAKIYPDFPRNYQIRFEDSVWDLTTDSRSNKKLGETIYYSPQVSFKDFFLPDLSNFLSRKLPIQTNNNSQQSLIWWLLLIPVLILLILKKNKKIVVLTLFLTGLLFWLAAFGLIVRSGYQYGWMVYYGPAISDLGFVKPGLLLVSFILIFLIYLLGKRYFDKNPYAIYLICFVFGIDWLVKLPRFTYLSNQYYFGLMLDDLRFTGFNFSKPFNISLVSLDFPAYQAKSFLAIDFNKFWENLGLSLVAYPFLHIIFGVILIYFLSKLPSWLRRIILLVLMVLFTLYLIDIFKADPRVAL